MPTALALSPHLDDAAFSCGGLLATLAGRGWRVIVATAFTASVPNPTGFALACQLDKGLSVDADYMALRREEDRLAAGALGIEAPLWLPFREAPHRGYNSAQALFQGETAGDDVQPALAGALAGLLDRLAPTLLLLPQAIGGHVDHVQLVRAIDRVDPMVSTLWWRDFPYTVREEGPREPFKDRMSRLPAREILLGPDAVRSKRAACHAYRSQIAFQFGGPAQLDAHLDAERGLERFRLQQQSGRDVDLTDLFPSA